MGSVGEVIFGGIGAVVGFVVGGPAGALYGWEIGAGVYDAGNYLLHPPDTLADSSTYGHSTPMNTVQEGTVVPLAYGLVKLGGNIIRTNNPADGDLRIILAHCQGEINGYHVADSKDQVWVNDILFDDLLFTEADPPHNTKTLYTGTFTQTASTHFTTKSCAYRGIAYTFFIFVKSDQIGDQPVMHALIEAKKCIPIGGGTAVWTRNPAKILYDFLLNVEGYSTSELDTNAFNSLATYCDQVPTGGTIERYRFDYVFDTNISIPDARKTICSAFQGNVIRSQGKIKPVWDAAVMADGSGGLATKTVSHSFTLDNIVKGSFSWKQAKKYNVVRVKYRDSDNDYKETTEELKDQKDVNLNGEYVLEQRVSYITDREIARRRVQFIYDKLKYTDYVCILTGFPDSQDLEPYDLVEVTHPLSGWSAKKFIVRSKSEDQFGRPTFVLDAYYSGIYSDREAAGESSYESDLPNPYELLDHCTNLALSEDGYTNKDGQYIPTATLTYTLPDNKVFWDHADIHIKTNATGDTYRFYGSDYSEGTGFTLDGAKGKFKVGQTITVKVISVNKLGLKSTSGAPTVSEDIDEQIVAPSAPTGLTIYGPRYQWTSGQSHQWKGTVFYVKWRVGSQTGGFGRELFGQELQRFGGVGVDPYWLYDEMQLLTNGVVRYTKRDKRNYWDYAYGDEWEKSLDKYVVEANGTITIRVRRWNIYNKASDWTQLTIDHVSPTISAPTVDFTGKDCILDWSPYNYSDFKQYKVEVYSDSGRTNLKRTEYTQDPHYNYSYEKNLADNTTLLKTVYFTVSVYNVFEQSASVNVEGTNYACTMTTPTAEFSSKDCILTWDAVTDSDVQKYEIKVYSDSARANLLRTEETQGCTYNYTFGKNNTDNSGSPLATVYFTVSVYDMLGNTDSQNCTGTNSAPSMSTPSVVFTSKDCVINWDAVTDKDFKKYEIKVYSNSARTNLLRTEESQSPYFVYTFEKNDADNSGSPIRDVYFTISVYDAFGQSDSQNCSGSNSIPSTPSAPTLTAFFSKLWIKWTAVSNLDIIGYNIYVDTSSPASTKVAFVDGESSFVYEGDPNTTYYVKISAVDSFGEGTKSSEASATTLQLALTSYDLDIPMTSGITWSTASQAQWTSGTLAYKGTTYSISSGNTTDAYIYWAKDTTPTSFFTSASPPTISENVYLMAYYDSASDTIYPAKQFRIIHAGILQANSITASQIAANTITAAEITAGTITSTEIAANTITANEIAANTITASEIAANTITANEIAASTITGTEISSATTITAGSGDDVGVLDGADATYRIYAGSATAANAPFRVTKDGGLTATFATIQTGTNGQRIVISSADGTLNWYNSSDNLIIKIDANTSGSDPGMLIDNGVLYMKGTANRYVNLYAGSIDVHSDTTGYTPISGYTTGAGEFSTDAIEGQAYITAASGYAAFRVGVHGIASVSNASNNDKAIGVYGYADSLGSGDAYGVYGTVTNNGSGSVYSGYFDGGDFFVKLGDATGTNKVIVQDSAGTEVSHIDSDGNIQADGKMIAKVTADLHLRDERFPCRMVLYRNKEMNNTLSTTDGTEITVSAIDTANNTITLSWLPYVPSIWSPGTGKKWAILNLENISPADPSYSGDYTEAVLIDSGTYSTRVLNYSDLHGADTNWSTGDKVAIYCPYRSNIEWYGSNPIIGYAGTGWRSKYVLPCGTFTDSSGNLILLVKAKSTAGVLSVGAFQSAGDDWTSWTAMNGDAAIFTGGGSTWRPDGVTGQSSVIKLPNEDRYISYFCGYNSTSGKREIGWVKFDENFSSDSIEYSSDEIIDSSGSSVGFVQPSVVYYAGKWRMVYLDEDDNSDPASSTNPWTLREAFSDTPEGPFTDAGAIITARTTNDGSYRSGHIAGPAYFMWKGRLYLFVSGTSRYKYSGTRGNAMYGLFYWDDRLATPAWVEDKRNPIFMNPEYGASLWPGEDDWAEDHMGGGMGLAIHPTNGKLYIFFPANAGTDTYQIGMAYMDIQTLYLNE